ncbi:MAG: hypothetical protein RIC19_24010 [Phaeodactylibacter sp.]|uniref:hypothetical protein n=1 Tax=Phaeodactylibacter sp. TaxID=1940289 RepID=UPI0032EFBD26
MKRIIGIVVLLCSSVFLAQAQPVDPAPKLIAKLGALSLLDPVLPSLNLMGEVQLGGPWYAQLEGGVILNADDWVEGLKTSNKKGFRLRPALRYYYQEQRNRYFMELMLVYRQVEMDITADFWISSETGPSYNRRLTYTVNSRKVSAFYNIGLFEYMASDRLMVELGIGLGATIQDTEFDGIPENASIQQTSIIRAYEPDFATTSADLRATSMLYFNIGYVLY